MKIKKSNKSKEGKSQKGAMHEPPRPRTEIAARKRERKKTESRDMHEPPRLPTTLNAPPPICEQRFIKSIRIHRKKHTI